MNQQTAPLVSILIAAYNSEAFITQTIQSCLDQGTDNYEIVISDDNSSDKTWELIDEINSEKISKHRQQKNIGEYPNRDFLIREAKGEYIIFIDGEDLLYPHALAVFSEYAKEYPGAGMFIAKEWDEKIIFPKSITPTIFARIEFTGYGAVGLNFTRLFLKRDYLLLHNSFAGTDTKLGDVYIQYLLGLQYETVLIPEGFSWWRRRSGQASEHILKNVLLYQSEINKFTPGMINGITDISDEEKKIMFTNYYGNIMRLLFYRLLRFKLGSVVKYWRAHPIPAKYISSFFKRPVRNYMDQFTGEYPLKDQ